MNKEIKIVIEDTIKEVVNGKIDSIGSQVKEVKKEMADFHDKFDRKNREQDADREEIKNSVKEIKEVTDAIYDAVKGFKFLGKLIGNTAKVTGSVALISATLWALFKFLAISAIKIK